MVGGGWMVTASQCPTKVYLALHLLRKVQRIMNCQIYTLSLSNTLLCKDDSAVLHKGRCKNQNENLCPCSNL